MSAALRETPVVPRSLFLLMDEQEARFLLSDIGRRVHALGYTAGSDGNLSVRLDEARILITPSGFSKGNIHPDQMVMIDLEGRLYPDDHPARIQLRPSSEMNMHLEVYRQRPEVGGVIHAHPPLGIACTLAGISLATHALPEVIYHLGAIPTAPYATPGTPEGAIAVRPYVRDHDALLIDRHGSLTMGESLTIAMMRLEWIEQAAKIMLAVVPILGRMPDDLPTDRVAALLAMRNKARGIE
jgi:L-fuculose-phosphate aldolase